MKLRALVFILLVLSLLPLLARMPVPARAQDASPLRRPIDVVIVLDDSASMATCWPWKSEEIHPTANCAQLGSNDPSDPQNLRYSAARLLVELADAEDRIAVIRFDSDAEPVGNATLTLVGSESNRQTIWQAMVAPTNYNQRGFTRIDMGLTRAADLLVARSGDEASRPGFILFLTDGNPTQPKGVAAQDTPVREQVQRLNRLGVQILPVALCTAEGCPVDFLRLMNTDPEEARNASELLGRFSRIFARMKPSLHVLTDRNINGSIDFYTRDAHGAQQIIVAAPAGQFQALQLNGNAQQVNEGASDPNLVVKQIASSALPTGHWTANAGEGAFVVARTATYPELVFPPSAASSNTTGPWYVPAGKRALLVGSVVGPGGGDPLLLNGSTPLQSLVANNSERWIFLPDSATPFTLTVGADTRPLIIQRSFALTPLGADKVPPVVADQPACLANEQCTLSAHFAPGPVVTSPAGTIYIADKNADGTEQPIYVKDLQCSDRACTDNGFKPQDGHTYAIRFLLHARAGAYLFGDWDEVPLLMKPAVYISGLPDPLNLATQPANGWEVTVAAGTTEDLGQLKAGLQLMKEGNTTPEAGLDVSFGPTVSGSGRQTARLQVIGLAKLKPGRYSGDIHFQPSRPPVGNPVQFIPETVRVIYEVSKASASLVETNLKFNDVLFRTTSDFHLDEIRVLPVRFGGAPFPLMPLVRDNKCGLTLTADPPRETTTGTYEVPFHLRSEGPVLPGTCPGTFGLSAGSASDFAIEPAGDLAWTISILPITARVINPGVDFQKVPYQTGKQFRVDQTVPLTLTFPNGEFPLIPEIVENNCPDAGLSLSAETLQPTADKDTFTLPLRLQSRGPVRDGTCNGTFALRPNPPEYYSIDAAAKLTWQVVIVPIEWGYRGALGAAGTRTDIVFPPLRSNGDEALATLLVYYTGNTPFSLDIKLSSVQNEQGQKLEADRDFQWIVPQQITTPPDKDSIYRVPVTLRALRDLPHDLQGSNYKGDISVRVNEVEGNPVPVTFRFRTPNWWDVTIAPWYALLLPGFLTFPLTLLALLLLFFVIFLLPRMRAGDQASQQPRRMHGLRSGVGRGGGDGHRSRRGGRSARSSSSGPTPRSAGAPGGVGGTKPPLSGGSGSFVPPGGGSGGFVPPPSGASGGFVHLPAGGGGFVPPREGSGGFIPPPSGGSGGFAPPPSGGSGGFVPPANPTGGGGAPPARPTSFVPPGSGGPPAPFNPGSR